MYILSFEAPANIIVAFVGNKVDLASSREVESSDARAYANENNAIFMETSAKTGINIEKLFSALGKCIIWILQFKKLLL